MTIKINALVGIPEVLPDSNISQLILDAMTNTGLDFEDGDIVVIAQKIVSKSENRFVNLDCVLPSSEAVELAEKVNKDPRKVQVIINESEKIIRAKKHKNKNEGVIISKHRLGFVSANAAVDESNIRSENHLLLLPENPDRSAQHIRHSLMESTNKQIGVVISDTFGRPWRLGLVNVAIGVSGVPVLVDLVGEKDAYGRELSVTKPALVDEIAASSGLLMGKDAMLPVIHFRGVQWRESDSAITDLLRSADEDLFQ